jgi:hypothetical protein
MEVSCTAAAFDFLGAAKEQKCYCGEENGGHSHK